MKNHHPHFTPFWSTASFGDTAETSPGELSGLSEHLESCKGARGRLFTVQCAIDSAHRFIAARFVTTLLVVAATIALALLLI
ncbi:MAG: hypothetical protein KF891_09255 [Rhizobacter sp.]|nr:hypothetical protein [Rhizobacter sp.]